MPASEQGVDPNRFSVIPRTLIFLFNERNQVLLIKGAVEKRIWAGKYNGMGGNIEPGEDILESALRELGEEAGIKDVPIRLCGQIMVATSPMQGVAIFIFKGRVDQVKIQASEEGEPEWVDLDTITEKPLVADLYELLPRIANHAKSDPIIIGKYTYDERDEWVISIR
jgi:8-oxo-dGTP diphosphatase